MQTTARDMRFHAGALLDTVARGESVTITYRGKPKAKLVPITEDKQPEDTEGAFGMWSKRADMADPTAHVRELRRGRFSC